MPTRLPWHSTLIGETVHHDNNLCTEGNKIELYYLKRGTGGRPLCKCCARLDQEEISASARGARQSDHQPCSQD
jgi:hypothetical protein